MKDYSTSVEEVTALVYDSDIYKRIQKITAKKKYDTSTLLWQIATAINTHYGTWLKQHSVAGKRRTFLLERIESELAYYEHPK